jgi:hypothetical protein
MTHYVFEQVGKIWRTIAGLAGRDARVGDRMAAPGSRAVVPHFHAASAAAAVLCFILSTGSSFSATYNNIPASFNLVNLSIGFVCVSGLTGAAPFYYLAPSTQLGQLGWTMTQPAQQLYPVGSSTGQYSAVQSTLSNEYTQPIAAAQLRFYLMLSGTTTCPATAPTSSPVGLFEFTGIQNAKVPTTADTTYQLTLDTSNVDNFQVPLMFELVSPPLLFIPQVHSSLPSSEMRRTRRTPPSLRW